MNLNCPMFGPLTSLWEGSHKLCQHSLFIRRHEHPTFLEGATRKALWSMHGASYTVIHWTRVDLRSFFIQMEFNQYGQANRSHGDPFWLIFFRVAQAPHRKLQPTQKVQCKGSLEVITRKKTRTSNFCWCLRKNSWKVRPGQNDVLMVAIRLSPFTCACLGIKIPNCYNGSGEHKR